MLADRLGRDVAGLVMTLAFGVSGSYEPDTRHVGRVGWWERAINTTTPYSTCNSAIIGKHHELAVAIVRTVPQNRWIHMPNAIASACTVGDTEIVRAQASRHDIQDGLVVAVRRGCDVTIRILLVGGRTRWAVKRLCMRVQHPLTAEFLSQCWPTEIDAASRAGDIGRLRRALGWMPQPTNRCLAIACAGGHDEVVSLLLEAGAEPCRRAVEAACRAGSPTIVAALLARGARLGVGWRRGLGRSSPAVLQVLLPYVGTRLATRFERRAVQKV